LVVLSADENAATLLAYAARLAPCVRRLALLAHRARAQPANDLLVVDVERQHDIDLSSEALEHRPQSLGLRHGTDRAVEDHAVRVRRLRQLLAQNAENHRIGHEYALVHEALRLLAERRARSPSGAEHVACRERRDLQVLGQERRLRALPGTGFPEE